MSKPIIAVDFDGVITCRDEYPRSGESDGKIIAALCEARRKGYVLILNTCRCGIALADALYYCRDRGLVLDNINCNSPERIAEFGPDCRKISADIILDDKSICWDRDVALAKLLALPDLSKPKWDDAARRDMLRRAG